MSSKIIDVSDSLNYDSNKNASQTCLNIYKDELYCAWTERNENNVNQIKVKKYDGNSWMEISNSLNYDSSQNAQYIIMQVYKDELYCMWRENAIVGSRSISQIKVKKYNGVTWSDVYECLNYNENINADYPTMQVYKNELYCAWTEDYQIKMKKYDGTNWIEVSNSLNYDSSQNAINLYFEVYKDELYCVWREGTAVGSNNIYQIKVKKYDGNTWSNISNSLNYDKNNTAYNPNLQVYKDELYCIWYESKGTSTQIKIKKYNKNNWNDTSDNLNYDISKNSYGPYLQVYKYELYCAWCEDNGSNNLIKMKKYNGINWVNVSDNLNYDSKNNTSNSRLQVYNNELYCIWQEYDKNNISQLKMKKYYSTIEKFLIKQSDKYISIKPEFYKNGKYQPLTLEGDITPNDNDFTNNGFDDLDDLCKEVSVENNIITVKSNASDYEEGKIFSFDIDSEFKNINNIE